jgi:predicted RNA binding protein YcfA (HicA-like mRNA interferase family)
MKPKREACLPPSTFPTQHNMGDFPQVLPKDVVKILQQCGFSITRQVGSHMRLAHDDGRKVTVAIHSKPLPIGTLLSILRQAQMSKEEFKKLLLG